MLNEYDALLEGDLPQGNEYDRLIGELQQGTEATLKQSVKQAQKTAPDAKAKARQIADRLKMPVEMVERNPELFTAQDSVESLPYEDLIRANPKLGQWLTDPVNAGVASDDIQGLQRVDQAVSFLDSVKRGTDIAQSLVYRSVQATGEAVGSQGLTEFGRAGALRNLDEAGRYGARSSLFDVRNPGEFGQWMKEFAGEQIPMIAPSVIGAGAGAVIGAPFGPVGVGIGVAIGAFLPSFVLNTGSVESAVKEKGGEDATATAAVFIGGSAVAALDTILPAKVGSQLTRVFGFQLAEQIAVKALAKPVAQRYVRRVAGSVAGGMATEGLTEAIQEAVEEVAAAAGTGTPVDWASLAAQAAEAGVGGAILGGAISGATEAVTPNHRVTAAQQGAQVIAWLGAAIEASKTAQRLPQAVESFIAQATKDGPVETVYAPVESWVTYWQGKGLDPATVAADVTGNPQAFEHAIATGADLSIPLAKYAARLAGTEHNAFFANEIRLSPEQMNAREADAFLDQQAQQNQEKSAPGGGDSLEQGARVGESVRTQLEGAGVEPGVASSYAALYESAFTNLAERAGLTPEALYGRYGLTITREEMQNVGRGNRPVAGPVAESAPGQQPAPDAGGPVQAPSDGGSTERRRLPSALDLPALDAEQYPTGFVRADESTDRARLTPDVARELARIADELRELPFEPNTWDFDVPDRSGNAAGGLANIVGGAAGAEVYGDILSFAPLNKSSKGTGVAKTTERTRSQVLAAIERAIQTGTIPSNIAEGAVRVAERRAAGDYRDISRPMLPHRDAVEVPAGVVEALSESIDEAVDAGALEDDSFDPSTFEQGEKPEGGLFDTLDTGEQQPRLPGAEDVRETEVPTPTFELPFSLTPPKGKGTRGKQETLFQSETALSPQTFARELQAAVDTGNDALIAKILTLPEARTQFPDLTDERAVRPPFPIVENAYQVGEALIAAAGGVTDIRERAHVETVPLARVVAVQDWVFPERTGQYAARQRVGDFRPIVLHLNGRYYLGDGTHRAVGAWARGDDSIEADVIDVDPSKLKDGEPTEFFQTEGKRGKITFGKASVTIELLKNADLSTFLHETGHFYLAVLRDLSSQSEQIAADVETLNTTLFEGAETETEKQERFARGFEAYLLEGNAPSPELRSVFARFSAWLKNVYRSLQGLNVQLTPGVRGVFDRLLASDEAIATAEAEGRIAPLFTDAASAGVSEDVFASYQNDVRKASESARDELRSRFMREVAREQTKQWHAQRRKIRQEVLTEIYAAPVYRARAAILRGTNPDGTPLVEGQTPEPMKGVPLDTVAELFGFSSGDELSQALKAAPPMPRAIKAETDRRMKALHGDLLTDPATVADHATAAVFGEGRAKVISAELKALTTGMARGTVPPTRVVNQIADARVRAMKVRDLKPGLFLMAAQRASQRAFEAFAKNDRQAVIQAKQQELLSLAMYRTARDAQETAERARAWVQRNNSETSRQQIGRAGEDYLDQWDGFLDRYEFARVSPKVLARRASLRRFVAALEGQGLPVDLPESVLDDARRVNWRELTVDDLRAVTDAMRQLRHLGRLKFRLLRNAETRELNDLAADLDVSIRSNATRQRKPQIETRLPQDAAARMVEGFFASHRKIASLAREMDGFQDGGPLWEAIIRPLNEAGVKEAEMNKAATERLAEIVRSAYSRSSRLYDQEFIPAINGSLSKMGRLMVAMNWGNEGNRQRIRSGYGWSDAQVQAVLDTLDATDARFVQDVLDFVNSYWSEIAAKQRRVTGVAPEKVEASPFRVNGIEMKGGYFPLKYDGRQSATAQSHLDLDAANLQRHAAHVHATTRRGHTEARAERVTLPVRLDFGVLFEHVQQVIHDLSHHETLIDVDRVLSHKTVQGAIYQTYGDVTFRQFKDAVRDVAYGDVPATTAFEQGINHLRKGATIAGLGWNLTTSFLQPLGLTQSVVRIGPKWVGRGMSRWIREAVTFQNSATWIDEKSPFMRLRAQTMQREINEIRNRVGVNTGRLTGWVDDALRVTTFDHVTQTAIADSFFWTIQQMQRVADIPTWLGAYEKARAHGSDDATAVALADQAVLDSQGGGQIKDLAGVQRGGPLLKLWTNFYSFFNTSWNLTVEETRRTNFKNPAQVGRLAADYLMLYIVPASLAFVLREAMKGGDSDEDLTEGLIRDNLAYLSGMLLGFRELGGAIQGYAGYEGPAGARVFSSLSRLVRQTEQGELDAAWWRAFIDSAGVLFHFPAGQVRRSIDGFTALVDGRTMNPLALVTGGPPQ